jgi:signal transduction histidine kinase
MDAMRMLDDDPGLARKIAVVGLAVSQAADELQQAAEHLLGAEEKAREAELRAHLAEDQLEQGATKNAELLDMLRQAREQQSEADERSRRAEQRLHIAQERARNLEEALHDLEAQLEEVQNRPESPVIVDAEREALAEAVAAEVRRPLTSIMGLTLALKHHDPNSSEGKDMVRQLASNARKLDRLVQEMLELDHIADGSLLPNRRRTDMEALVQRVVEESPDLANRDISLKTEHVVASVDPTWAEQMVETLLANAGRRTVPGNTVWINVGSGGDGDGVVVAVDDQGPEVPDGLRQALFAALQERADQKKRARGTTGLSLLSRLADIHGGRAWVEERPGGGASFRVFLPDVPKETIGSPQEERGVAALALEEGGLKVEEEGLGISTFEDETIAS